MTEPHAAPPTPPEPQPLTIALPDGTMEAWLYEAAAPAAPVLVWLPAMGIEARYYRPLAEALAAEGCHVLPVDLRGLGRHPVRASRRTDFGYEEQVSGDLPAVLAAVAERLPASPVLLGGHSLGAHLAVLRMARDPAPIAGFVFAAAGTNHYRAWPFPQCLAVLALGLGVRAAAETLGWFPGRSVGFLGTEARSVIRTWHRLMLTGRFHLPGAGFDYERELRAVDCPGLVLTFADDRMAPPAAARSLYGKMPRADVTHWHVHPADLGQAALGHFRWVRAIAPLAPRIRDWIRAHVA